MFLAMSDTVIIVDDEESVRRTFQEWLAGSGLDVNVFVASDAESALRIANEQPIDLAILDWNLGSGSDGLKLLEDLVEFRPDVVAILVTGFANQATPLDALRMGVRDYLEKNQSLNRETFVRSVTRQLNRIHPAKRQRELNRSLAAFREAIERVLPIVQTSAAFNDPVPLPEAVKSLLRFLIQATGATDGALLIRHLSSDGTETTAAFSPSGEAIVIPNIAFSQSLAASVASHQEPMVVNGSDVGANGGVELLPFEKGRQSILAAPLQIGGGTSVVLELFDKPHPGFTDGDRHLVAPAAVVGADLLRQALAERQTHRLLFDAVDAVLSATAGVTELLSTSEESPQEVVMERLREGLANDKNAVATPEATLQLVEAVRTLAVRHGPIAVEHCIRVVNDLGKLLDSVSGITG
jgi:two-component system nitrogen regulation response regulator NtrX